MNSVLQCLTHTPPLAEVLLSEQPLASGQARGAAGAAGQAGLRALAATRELVTRSLQHRVHVIPPVQHARGLRQICSRRAARPARGGPRPALQRAVSPCVLIQVRAAHPKSRAFEGASHV
jgi:hypothetical protein